MIEQIKTVRDLRELIENIDDDFTLDIHILREKTEEELEGSHYPYPYEMIDGHLEYQDTGYSDKVLCLGVYVK